MNNLKFILILVVSVCLSGSCVAQTEEYSVEMGMLNAMNTNDYETALTFSKKYMEIVKNKEGENSTEYYQVLHQNAFIVGNLEGITKEIELTIEILDFSKKPKPKPFYCQSSIWKRLSTAYGEIGQIEQQDIALDSAILYGSKKNGDYEDCLVDKSINLSKKQKYVEAELVITQCIGYFEENEIKNSHSYLRALQVCFNIFSASHSYEKSIPYLIKAEQILKERTPKPFFGDLLNSMAILYYEIGEKEKGSAIFRKLINYNDPQNILEPESKFDYLSNFASIQFDNGDIDSSFYYLDKAKLQLNEIIDPFVKKKNLIHFNYNTGLQYAQLGNVTRAIDYFSNNLELIGNDSTNEAFLVYYFFNIHNLANMYAEKGDINAALTMENRLINLVKDHAINNKKILKSFYNAMGHFNLKKRDFTTATFYFEKEILVNKELFGERSLQVFLYQAGLGKIQFHQKKYADALPIFIKSYEAGIKLYSACNTRYNMQTFFIISSFKNLKQPEKALSYLEKVQNLLSCVYEKEMQNVDEKTRKERVKSLEEYNGTIYEFAKTYPTYGSTYAYDLALLNKGIVLNYSQNWKKTLENTQDATLKSDFEKWLMSKRFLSRQYQVELSKRSNDTDSIERFADQLEGNLSRMSKVFQTATAKVNWQDVQAKLKDGEAAIEFIDYKYSLETLEGDTAHQYIAILLRKGEQPKVVSLYDEKTIKSIIGNTISDGANYLSREALLIQLWQPLEPYLQGIKKIYYSPSGLLNRVSFGAIAYDAGKYLSDKYEFRLLRSTRELVVSNLDDVPKTTNSTHFIIGNIDFGNNTNQLAKTKDGGICGLLNFENGEKEFSIFTKLANDANVNILAKQKKEATETYVKSKLVSPSPEVLIFSTHGYYEEKPRENATNPLQSIKEPLLRTGIMLTDANLAWCGNPITAGKEDGLLTAYEISNMDLSNTQVVVLSACQSGVGDLQGSEGVYGLQRAFKMAGVKNVLCTLWKVDAVTAQDFVSIFYAEILNGRTAHEAFVVAQNNLRNAIDKDNSFKYSPNLWGAFVLVE